jgi:hypothetical protein
MTTSRWFAWTALLLLVASGVAGALSAQTAIVTPAGSIDDRLLEEIRGLRADLNQALSGNIRAQLLVGRLQLQEQRLNALNARRADVQRFLAVASQSQVASDLKRMESALRESSLSPDDQRGLEMQVTLLKEKLAGEQREEQRLRAQEADLAAQLAAEQGRWISCNDRLDEIERSLPDAGAKR